MTTKIFIMKVRYISILLLINLVGCKKVEESHPRNFGAESNRQMLIDSLIEQVKHTPKTGDEMERRVKLVEQIGDEKVVGAVPFLVAKIMDISPISTSNAADFEETFPCSVALIKIGKPAVEAVSKRFDLSDSAPERMVLAYVLYRINGKDWTVKFLNDRLSKKKAKDLLSELRGLIGWIESQ